MLVGDPANTCFVCVRVGRDHNEHLRQERESRLLPPRPQPAVDTRPVEAAVLSDLMRAYEADEITLDYYLEKLADLPN